MVHKRFGGHYLSWTFVLLVVLSPLLECIPFIFPSIPVASAAPWSGGGATINATFIDASHIAVTASGTYTWGSGSNKEVVDFSGLQGIYYAGSISPYVSDRFTPAGNKYWFENNNQSTGGSNCNTDIDILSYAAGSVTARINPHLAAAAGSNDAVGSCEAVQMPNSTGSVNITISDPANGNVTTFNATGTGNPNNVTYSNGNNSTVMFYKASGSEIDASTVDTSIGTGSDGKYIFKQEGNTNVYQEQGPNGAGCSNPDTITLPAGGGTGTTTSATYTYHDNKCTVHTYKSVLVLNSTPETSFKSTTGSDPPSGSASGTDNSGAQDCGGGALNWMICPVNWVLQRVGQALTTFIDEQLTINTRQLFGTGCTNGNAGNSQCSTSQAYYKAWNTFRILGTSLIIIAGLIMVSSQALGFEIMDAYTVRKVLPRLLIAVIGMSLSWPLLSFLINFFNELGRGVQALIYAPFSHFPNHDQLVAGFVNWGLIAFIVALSPFIAVVLPILGTGILALLIGLLILIIRQIAVTLIVILAPFAIAAYVLPNTQRIWKIWYDNFLGLMFMFPIITAFLAVGQVFAAVGESGNTVQQIVGMVAWFVPFFLIPLAFRMATGFISTVAGFVNDRSKGGFDRLRNARQNMMAERRKKAQNYSLFSDKTGIGRRLNSAYGAASHPWRDLRRGRRGIQQGRQTGYGIYGAEHLKEDTAYQTNQNDDNFLLALANRELAEQKLAKAQASYRTAAATYGAGSQQANSALAGVDARQQGLDAAAQVKHGELPAVRQAALDALTKTGYQFATGEEGYQELAATARSVAGSDQGAYTKLMDGSQFNLKNAGRFDLGGINHGAGYDADTGLGKADPYTLATRGKTNSIEEKGNMMHRAIAEADTAASAGDAATYNAKMKEAAVHLHELRTGWDSATGANKEEFLKQIRLGEGDGDLAAWRNVATGQTMPRRENYVAGAVGWSAADQARGWRTVAQPITNDVMAREESRGARRPNPLELEP